MWTSRERGIKICLDSVYILRVEPKDFADGSDV